nr:retrotransposon protein, putative, Ty1-copia subclass [Tanacetum cinerariifolium]
MALNTAQTKTNSSAFRSMLEKHQLTRPNFNEWFRTLKLVVRTEKLQDVFETALPPALGKPPGVELQELVNMFHSCKQVEGQSVSDHVLLKKSYLDQLATINYAFPDKVSISFILNSLSSEFHAYVQNYNMQSMEKTIREVHSLLTEFEKSIKRNKQPIVGASSTLQVMAIQGGRVQKYKPQGKANGKGKGKGPQNSYPTKPKKPQPYKKEPELMKKKKKTGGQNVASTSLDNELFDQCVSCISGKMTRKPFSHKTKKVKDVLGLIHTDVCGLLRHVSKKGASYFITFTDDYSRYGYVYLFKHKHEVFETFKRNPPYTPQHNGVSKRRNRTLLNMVRSMMSLATLPLSFWDYALESATHILNMVSTKKVDKTPYELWHGKVPNLSYLKVWGCEAHVKRHTPDKLQQRSVKCIFVGYHKETIVEEHSLGDLNEPAIYKAALSNPEFEKWLVAMNAKMQSMYDNKVWRLAVLPPNAKVVKSKWIYKKKTYIDGKNVPYDSAVGSIMYDVRGAVVWKSSKQSTTAQHAIKAKYIAESEAAKEDVWIRKFIDELGVVLSNDYPIKINCDNSATIIVAKELGIQKGARHFKRKYHFVRECIETRKIDIVKVHTDDNLANPFTKALAGPKPTRHARIMGLRPASIFILNGNLDLSQLGTDLAKTTKKQSKPDKIEHKIEKNAQKPEASIEVLLAKETILKLIQAWDDKQIESWSLPALLLQLLNDLRTIDEMVKQQHSIQCKEYLENSSNAITTVSPTEEPEYSLSIGEYEVSSDDEIECDVLVKDEFSPVFTTFSNSIFDDNDDFTSSGDESLSDEENVPMEDFKVYSNPLFDDKEINSDIYYFNTESDLIESLSNHDILIDSSSKFDYLEEFSGALMPTSIIDEQRIKREHEEYISLMEKLLAINSFPHPLENFHANTIDETLPTSPILVEDGDSQREEIDIFTSTDDLLPPALRAMIMIQKGISIFLKNCSAMISFS